MDTTSIERATRKVNVTLEQMLFTNTTYSFGEQDARSLNTIYSYINHPDRNTGSLTAAWDDSSTTPAVIKNDVRQMKQASLDANHYGPWILYVPSGYETRLDDDYDTSGSSTQTIRDRIMKFKGIEDVKVNYELANDNVVLVEMQPETVRLVSGMGVQAIQWITKYKVMTIQVPQVRSDQSNQSGVVHYSV
jgi:hypothetical protein